MKTGIRVAGAVFLLTWSPLTVWRGLRLGRSMRVGPEGESSAAPLVEGMIQIGAVMLAPALFVALFAFALWAWREEWREERRHDAGH